MRPKLLFLLLFVILLQQGRSQNRDSVPQNTDTVAVNILSSSERTPLPSEGDYGHFLTNKEFYLSIFLVITLWLVLAIEIWAIRSLNIGPEHAIKLLIISMVIMGALLLIMGGYDDQLIAPAFGLFGTIAGYVLGRSATENNRTTENRNP